MNGFILQCLKNKTIYTGIVIIKTTRGFVKYSFSIGIKVAMEIEADMVSLRKYEQSSASETRPVN